MESGMKQAVMLFIRMAIFLLIMVALVHWRIILHSEVFFKTNRPLIDRKRMMPVYCKVHSSLAVSESVLLMFISEWPRFNCLSV